MQIICGAVLFDMDGVLVDSTPAVARVWRRWSLTRGLEPDDVVQKAQGRPSMSTIRELLPGANHEMENREVERAEIEDVEGVVALPGALKLISALPEWRRAIVTSATRPLAEVRLRAAGLPIPKCFVTANDVLRGKPDPEPYVKGAEWLGMPTSECVVIEDSFAGIRAGKTAGARVIALRTMTRDAGVKGDEELKRAGADWVVDDCGAIAVDGAPGANGQAVLILKIT
ncbi:MAG: HAD family hydrolase [Candidatus Acidiferrum sp.]